MFDAALQSFAMSNPSEFLFESSTEDEDQNDWHKGRKKLRIVIRKPKKPVEGQKAKKPVEGPKGKKPEGQKAKKPAVNVEGQKPKKPVNSEGPRKSDHLAARKLVADEKHCIEFLVQCQLNFEQFSIMPSLSQHFLE